MYPNTYSRRGILLLVSGPSGSGKTTLCRYAAAEKEAVYATSCTTRQPRPGEVHGEDYYFLSVEEFKKRVTAGEFIEYAEVHKNFYGTLRSEVITHLEAGTDVVIDIDVQGAESIRTCDDPAIQTSLIELFIMPATEEELHRRLTGRGTDSQEVIDLRMKNALEEIQHCPKYTYRLLSKTIKEDYIAFLSLIRAERLRASRLS